MYQSFKDIFLKHKLLFLSFIFFFIFSGAVSVFSAFSGYAPGEILDPECEPGSENCVVNLPEGGGTDTPAGDHGQLQFNYGGYGGEGGALGASSNLYWE